MNTGILWDLKTIDITVAAIMEAKGYYKKMYGITPDLCYYSDKSELPELPKYVTKELTVTASPEILPGYLWLGVKKTEEEIQQ
jgi:hypothetical protein